MAKAKNPLQVAAMASADRFIREESPPFGEAVASSFMADNWVGAMITASRFPTTGERIPGFKPDFKGYEDYAELLYDVGNPEDERAVKAKIRYFRQRDDVLLRSGLGTRLAAGFIAAVPDPLNLIPGIPIFTAARGAGRLRTALSVGSRTASGALAAETVNELLIQGLDESRTASQSLTNIAATTAFGFTLGAAIGGHLGGREAAVLRRLEAERQLQADIQEAALEEFKAIDYDGDGLPGVNQEMFNQRVWDRMKEKGVDVATAQGAGPIRDFLMRNLRFVTGIQGRLEHAGIPRARFVTSKILSSSGARIDSPAPGTKVEIGKMRRGVYAATRIVKNEQAYGKYLEMDVAEPISKQEFSEQISLAMSNRDEVVDALDPQTTKAVEAAAKDVRDFVENWYTNPGLETGALSRKDTGSDPTWFSRVWLDQKMVEEVTESGEFRFVEDVAPVMAAENDISIDEAKAVLRELIDTVSSGPGKTYMSRITDDNAIELRSPLRARTFQIATKHVREWVDTDVNSMIARLDHTMGPDLELAKVFRPAQGEHYSYRYFQQIERDAEAVPDMHPQERARWADAEELNVRDMRQLYELERRFRSEDALALERLMKRRTEALRNLGKQEAEAADDLQILKRTKGVKEEEVLKAERANQDRMELLRQRVAEIEDKVAKITGVRNTLRDPRSLRVVRQELRDLRKQLARKEKMLAARQAKADDLRQTLKFYGLLPAEGRDVMRGLKIPQKVRGALRRYDRLLRESEEITKEIDKIQEKVKRREIKQRKFDRPDRDKEDVRNSYAAFLDQMEELRRNNYVSGATMEHVLEQIGREGNDLIKAGKISNRHKKRVLADLRTAIGDVRNAVGQVADSGNWWFQLERMILQSNALAKMGGVLFSSLGDPALATFTTQMAPMGRAMRAKLKAWMSSAEGKAMLSDELFPQALRAFETVNGMQTRSRSMAEITSMGRSSNQSLPVKFLDWVSDKVFTHVFMINRWTGLMKETAALAIQDNIIRAARRVVDGHGTADDIANLAQSGIDENMARRIITQVRKLDQTTASPSEINLAATHRWDDEVAREVFESAVMNDLNKAVVTPTAGDRPRWMHIRFLRMIGQFRSFSLAANNKITISGFQGNTAAFMGKAVTSVQAGMVVWALKEVLAGRDPFEQSVNDWVINGIDRSGVPGMLTDMNAMMERLPWVNNLSLSSIFGGKPPSRFQQRNFMDVFFGPTAGFVRDLQRAVQLLGPDASRGDLDAFRRLLWTQNAIGFATAFDLMEEAASDVYGFEEREDFQ